MKLLVGYDASNASANALKTAILYARAFEASVVVVTSLLGKNEASQQEINQARDHLAKAKGLVQEAGIQCETHLLIRAMTPGEDIVAFAREKNVDQIIVGAKRRSKIGKLVFGSNAQYIVLHAHCPVVTVK